MHIRELEEIERNAFRAGDYKLSEITEYLIAAMYALSIEETEEIPDRQEEEN